MWRKAILFIAGFILTTLGITLVLQQWESVVLVFKAFIGAILAVIGLVILFSATLKVMIKLVIFDLDGTLVNAYPAVSRSVNYTLKSLGFAPRSHTEIKRSVGSGDRKLMVHFVGEKLADKALAIYRPHHIKALKQGAVKLLPGALGILKFLKGKGYKLAIASNRPTKFTRIILKVLGLLRFFDVVLCADKVDRPKPYPDILWAIAKRLSLDKSEFCTSEI